MNVPISTIVQQGLDVVKFSILNHLDFGIQDRVLFGMVNGLIATIVSWVLYNLINNYSWLEARWQAYTLGRPLSITDHKILAKLYPMEYFKYRVQIDSDYSQATLNRFVEKYSINEEDTGSFPQAFGMRVADEKETVARTSTFWKENNSGGNSKVKYWQYIGRYIYCNDGIVILAAGGDVWARNVGEWLKFVKHVNSLEYTKPTFVNIAIINWDGKQHDIDRSKTFDVMCFDRKAEIIDLLNNFKTGTSNPYVSKNLGFLLWGPPGSGKTTFVSALANHMGRGIKVCNTKNCNTIETMTKYLLPNDANEWVIFFDEFDLILEKLDKPNEQKEIAVAIATTNTNASKDIIEKALAADNTVNRWDLLTLMDGIVQASGRICVFATNYPDRIPPALKRPGRIDVQLELGRLSSTCGKEMLCKLYPAHSKKFNDYDFPDNTWMPVDVINMFRIHSMTKVLEMLKSPVAN